NDGGKKRRPDQPREQGWQCVKANSCVATIQRLPTQKADEGEPRGPQSASPTQGHASAFASRLSYRRRFGIFARDLFPDPFRLFCPAPLATQDQCLAPALDSCSV